MRLLAGDIGGTNARLVSYEVPDDFDFSDLSLLGKHRIVFQWNYKNEDFPSFSDVLLTFLAEPLNVGPPFDACCFAVAGPVVNNQINFTNRDGWIIDRQTIQDEFQIKRVQLVNDFVASGYGLLALSDEEVITLQPGKKREDAPIALVGAGTGLGECFLSPASGSHSRLTAYPSEGGHVEFAPRSVVEEELLRYLQDNLGPELARSAGTSLNSTKKANSSPSPNGHGSQSPKLPLSEALTADRARMSVERVVSGGGLENIYNFLRERHPEMVDSRLDEEYNESSERGRLIGKHQYNYPLFRYALEIMFGIYGSEVGNVALKYLPTAGLYIAGRDRAKKCRVDEESRLALYGAFPRERTYVEYNDRLSRSRCYEGGSRSSWCAHCRELARTRDFE